MSKYFFCYAAMGSLLTGLCFLSSSLYGREEIAQGDFHEHYNARHPLRMGDWDYHENWQYSRHAFFEGDTQPQAYRRTHPYGPAGIGYDADEDYLAYLRELRGMRQEISQERQERLRDRYSHRDHVSQQQRNEQKNSRY